MSAAGLRNHSRKLEDLGFDMITIADHFDAQLGPIAALMAAADATTAINVSTLVFCNDYRHPVVLAKEAATLDLLTEGRFRFGIGAGWMRTDYTQSGMSFDDPRLRVDRMEESIAIIKALWSGGTVNHVGAHYTIEEMVGTPRPATTDGPPIIIGGGGRRVLELAAREADIVGLNPKLTAGLIDSSAGPSATPEATDRKIGWIRTAAGERFSKLELQVRLEFAQVTDDPEPIYDVIGGGFGLTRDDCVGTPHALVGSIGSMVEDLIERRERWGISSIGIPADAVDQLAPVVAQLAGN